MKHSIRFIDIVQSAKMRIKETDIQSVKSGLDNKEKFTLVDVREESEWNKNHLPCAIHLGKGVIERDIEKFIPDLDHKIVLYCGGGSRSALAADNLQKMGYKNVVSMKGGYRGWEEAGYEII